LVTFTLFGIPVHVAMAFWVTAAFLSLSQLQTVPTQVMLATFVIVFLAVLVHELGHALVARAFGAKPVVYLHSFGGTTAMPGVKLSRGQSIVTTLAGPAAGFLTGAICHVASRYGGPRGEVGKMILDQVLFCTYAWSAINLLPVLPLDGGIILREALGPRFGRATYVVSSLVGAAVCTFCLVVWYAPLGAILFGLATLQSVRSAWNYGEVRRQEQARTAAAGELLETSLRAFDRDDLGEAERKAALALQFALEPERRDAARRVIVSVALRREQGQLALGLLDSIESPTGHDVVLRAQALDLNGERDEAFRLLELEASARPGGPALGPFLLGLWSTGKGDRALEIALRLIERGSVEGLTTFAQTLFDEGQYVNATRVRSLLFSRTREGVHALEAARASMRSGDIEGALSQLEAALAAGLPAGVSIRDERDFSSLVDDDRFRRLVSRG
jgi:Zn-dependent protease